jgi:hypothetical protein
MPVENLAVPPIENLTGRRGDEPQFVATSWRRRRRLAGSRVGRCVECLPQVGVLGACGSCYRVVAEIMGWSAATAVRMAKRYGDVGESARRQAMTALEAPMPTAPPTVVSTLVPAPPTVQ